MSNSENKKHLKSISEVILGKEFEETKVPIVNKRLYNADAVDHFLTKVASEVEKLEQSAKSLFEFYEQNKNGRVVEGHPGPIQESLQTNETESMNVQKSGQRLERMQLHITELFEEAETKADKIISAAEVEKLSIIRDGKLEAERILSEAQKNADEIHKATEEKINEAKLVKNEIHRTALEVQNEIFGKVQELESIQSSFSEMSQKLRGLISEKTA